MERCEGRGLGCESSGRSSGRSREAMALRVAPVDDRGGVGLEDHALVDHLVEGDEQRVEVVEQRPLVRRRAQQRGERLVQSAKDLSRRGCGREGEQA